MKLALLKISALCAALFVPSQAAEKPNILFIAIDDMKPDLGCYGVDMVKTPNMDKLAARGALFLNSHCNQAVCGPSRASLMTGLRPDRTKVHDLKTITREVTPWVTTLPQHFKNHGYITAGTGKIYDPRSVDKKSDELSWSQPFKLHSGLPYNKDYPEPVLGSYQSEAAHKAYEEITASGKSGYGPVSKAFFKRGLKVTVESTDVPDDAYADGAYAKMGAKFIRDLSKKDEPFFVAVGFKKPHLPFIAPKKYWDLYQRDSMPLAKFKQAPEGAPPYALHNSNELRSYDGVPADGPLSEAQQRELIHGYYACISYIDAQVGLLMETLEKEGQLENTIVILWGDHGWHLGDHGIWCKHTNYEQSTRSPLIIAGPGIESGVKTQAPTEFVDIFPSLCELSHIPNLENLDGISFVPVVSKKAEKVRESAVSQFGRGQRMGYGLRNERFRYVLWVNNSEKKPPLSSLEGKIAAEELYDYETDPLETKNLATDPAHAETLKKLRAEASSFLTAQAERIAREPK